MKKDEELMQSECIKWFRLQYKNILIHHSPNGGKRPSKTGKNGVRYCPEGAKMKRLGSVAGFPDLMIFSLGCEKDIHSEITDTFGALFVEFKTEKGTLTPVQKEVHKKLQNSGYKVVVCRSFDEFKEAVENYLN